jgi:hypothetical protein
MVGEKAANASFYNYIEHEFYLITEYQYWRF